MDRLELARWMAAEVDREQAIAGREAMRRLSGDVTLRGLRQTPDLVHSARHATRCHRHPRHPADRLRREAPPKPQWRKAGGDQKEVLQCELEAEKAATSSDPNPFIASYERATVRDKIMDLHALGDGACELSPRLLTGDILGDTFAHLHADQR